MPTGKGGGRTGWPQKEAVVRDDAPTCWWRIRGMRARCCWLGKRSDEKEQAKKKDKTNK